MQDTATEINKILAEEKLQRIKEEELRKQYPYATEIEDVAERIVQADALIGPDSEIGIKLGEEEYKRLISALEVVSGTVKMIKKSADNMRITNLI